MCGIAGILHFNGKPVDEVLLRRLTSVLQHRGPDDEGFFVDESLGLGFRRLSIIDLSGGRQPMCNEDRTVTVIFNGEIYNFQELRNYLRQQGHNFQTASDTEVIVHGFETWGDEVVDHLNGMFAFAVWDSRRRRLLLARDRLGIKPLFYTQTSDTLAFASEIKSLLLLPGFDPAVNQQSIFEYFSHHFIPGSGTVYQQIHKVQPGELLTVADGQVKTRKYWRPVVKPTSGRTLEEWCQDLQQRLKEAVRLQLVADVPLGVFLSGGLDSSAVTAAMAELGLNEIRTFNVGFEVPKYDETRFAAMVSQHLGTTHETFRVDAQATDLLPKLLWHLDEPLADATIIPTYLLSQATRQRVTVALSGEGGDEIFGGYTHYQGLQLNRWLQLLPVWLRRLIAAAAGHLPMLGSPRLGYFKHRMERIASTSLYPLFQGYTRKVAFFTPEDQRRLFSEDFQRQTAAFPYLGYFWAIPEAYPDIDPIAQANLADLSVFLPDSLLVKVDRMSMANSLEVRVPLLDHTLVDFALSMPWDLKAKGLETKRIFRQALESSLPPLILKRRKRGFNPPVEFWLQQHLLDYAREHHLMETLAETGYFNLAYVQEMTEAHIRGQRDYGKQLWALLVFAIWWRRIRGRGEWQT